MSNQFYLLNVERSKKELKPIWWKSNSFGYTDNIFYAKKFSKRQAESTCNDSKNKNAYLCSKVFRISPMGVCTLEQLRKLKPIFKNGVGDKMTILKPA